MGLKVVVGLHLYYKEDINRVLKYFNTYKYFNNYHRYTREDRVIPDINRYKY